MSLKPSKDIIHDESTNERHLNVKKDILRTLYNKTMTFHFKILFIKLSLEFQKQYFITNTQKWAWKVILWHENWV